MQEIVMPKLGNTVESVIMVAWHKEVGEQVNTGEVLCEVETDKAMMEVKAEESGILLARLFDVGDEIPVLSRFAVLGEEGEEVSALPTSDAPEAGVDEPARRQSNDAAPDIPGMPAASVTTDRSSMPSTPEASKGAHISPRAWKLALGAGLGPRLLADAGGSGPGGRIIERDVRRALTKLPRPGADSRTASTDSYPVPGAPAYGPRMHVPTGRSARLTLHSSAPAGSILNWRQSLKSVPGEGQDVSINHLLMFNVARLLPHHPELNATFHESEIRRYTHVNLGFTVDTPGGLMTPVIREADRRSLYSLTAEARRLADACKEGHIAPENLAGGTFTVTNLGALGIESFTPVPPLPEVAILGIGAITNSPIEAETGIGIEKRIRLSLSIDLQAVDGASGARFLAKLARVFARPELLAVLY